ncbi:MAG: DNA polymerase IV [Candidatus Bathyarchaeia archaeon]
MARFIFHVDLDAFYASVEQRDNPALYGKPLIIGADPKEGKGRGVVVACSYEARQHGIRSGQPISIAYRLMPQVIYLRPNFETYEDVSSDIMSFLRKCADKFEQASVDEAYMDVTQVCELYDGPVELANRIKREVKDLFGLTCSIGIAPNKSAAKIASDMQKPNGLTFIDEAHIREILAPLPVSKISGIGSKTESSLRELGIVTIGDLAKASPRLLHAKFGKSAVWLWAIANAEERVEVEENFTMRSIGAEHTFEKDTADWTTINRELTALSETVYNRLVEEGMAFRTVVLKIRFRGFETHTRNKSLKFSTTEESVILETVRELCAEFMPMKKEVRLVGVRVSGLGSRPAATIDSFTK